MTLILSTLNTWLKIDRLVRRVIILGQAHCYFRRSAPSEEGPRVCMGIGRHIMWSVNYADVVQPFAPRTAIKGGPTLSKRRNDSTDVGPTLSQPHSLPRISFAVPNISWVLLFADEPTIGRICMMRCINRSAFNIDMNNDYVCGD